MHNTDTIHCRLYNGVFFSLLSGSSWLDFTYDSSYNDDDFSQVICSCAQDGALLPRQRRWTSSSGKWARCGKESHWAWSDGMEQLRMPHISTRSEGAYFLSYNVLTFAGSYITLLIIHSTRLSTCQKPHYYPFTCKSFLVLW